MSAPLHNVVDHVRASHVGSKILEPAVITEIVEKYIGYRDTTDKGVPQEGPLYWVRFEIGGMLGLRWQNELVAATVTEPAL